MMMMMKLEGELYAARLRLDGLAAKSDRITCRPALVAGTCALGCQSTYWVCLTGTLLAYWKYRQPPRCCSWSGLSYDPSYLG